jgi:hypothetical protein
VWHEENKLPKRAKRKKEVTWEKNNKNPKKCTRGKKQYCQLKKLSNEIYSK